MYMDSFTFTFSELKFWLTHDNFALFYKYIKAAESRLRYLRHRPVEEQWASVRFVSCAGV